MKRRWTEARAWAYLAQRWDHPQITSDPTRAIVAGERYASGLCFSISALVRSRYITSSTAVSMYEGIPLQARRSNSYVWPRTETGARSRAAFCRQMAKLTARPSKTKVAR